MPEEASNHLHTFSVYYILLPPDILLIHKVNKPKSSTEQKLLSPTIKICTLLCRLKPQSLMPPDLAAGLFQSLEGFSTAASSETCWQLLIALFICYFQVVKLLFLYIETTFVLCETHLVQLIKFLI